MRKMLGALGWRGQCSCCNGSRTKHQIRQEEKRELRDAVEEAFQVEPPPVDEESGCEDIAFHKGSYTGTLHRADDGTDELWAEVDQLPGCFASGSDFEELNEALDEAIYLYLTDMVDSAPSASAS